MDDDGSDDDVLGIVAKASGNTKSKAKAKAKAGGKAGAKATAQACTRRSQVIFLKPGCIKSNISSDKSARANPSGLVLASILFVGIAR